jgi:hypothetical protein
MADDTAMPASPPGAPPERQPGGRHARHRGRIALAVVIGILVLVVAALVLPYALRDQPEPVTVEEAVEDFRASTSTVDPTAPAFRRPDAGVYTAEGAGRAEISFPPNSQEDGAVMPASLEWLPYGCWRWRITYNDAHWHEVDLCPVGPDLVLTGQRNLLGWDFGTATVENRADFVCDPPSPVIDADATPGTTFQHRCTGSNSAAPGSSVASGPAVVRGVETLTIGGVDVRAIHQSQRRDMSGGQEGVDEEDWWYAVDTGLPLRVERTINLTTSSPFGSIDYTESGWWQLSSLEPRT